jgi:tetratricopeptide (TPR) repeat protein
MVRTRLSHVDDPKKVGRRLKEARLLARLSQRGLSFPGCTPAYISRIESGERVPSLQLIHEFARRLHVSPEFLATGVEAADHVPQDLVEAEVALRLGEVEEAAKMFRERLKDDPRNAQALAGLGQIAYRRENFAGAIDYLERALHERRGRLLDDPGAIEALARAYAFTGALEVAIALLERALEQAVASDLLVDGLRFRVLLANALIDNGSVQRAEQILADTIQTVEKLRDPLTVARVYWTQGRFHTHHKDPRLGARYIRKALDILERTENDGYVAMAYHLLALAEVGVGNPGAALEHVDRGRELLGSSIMPRESAMFAIEETRAFLALNRVQEAAKAASVALGQITALDPQDKGRAYVLLGEVFHRSGDLERAIELLELAVELLEESGKPFVLDAAGKLADALEEAGRSKDALSVLRRAVSAGATSRA